MGMSSGKQGHPMSVEHRQVISFPPDEVYTNSHYVRHVSFSPTVADIKSKQTARHSNENSSHSHMSTTTSLASVDIHRRSRSSSLDKHDLNMDDDNDDDSLLGDRDVDSLLGDRVDTITPPLSNNGVINLPRFAISQQVDSAGDANMLKMFDKRVPFEANSTNMIYDESRRLAVHDSDEDVYMNDNEIKDFTQEKIQSLVFDLQVIKNKGQEINPENIMSKQFFKFRSKFPAVYNSFLLLKGQKFEKRNAAREKLAQTFVKSDVFEVYLNVLKTLYMHPPCKNWLTDDNFKTTSRWRLFYNAILTFYNYTNMENFAVALIAAPRLLEFLIYIINDRRDDHLAERHDMIEDKLTKAPITILYNCSMYYEAREALRNHNVVEVLQPYLNSPHEGFQMTSMLCIAYLANEKQSQIFLAKPGLLRFLVNHLNEASNRADRSFGGWNVLEMTKGLGRLALNDTNKQLIVENGALDTLLNIGQGDRSAEERIEALRTVWTLCFDDKNKAVLKANADWTTLLNICQNSEDETVSKLAKSIYWTNEGYNHQQIQPNTGGVTKAGKHVMLSYQWDNQETVINIKNVLESEGFPVWLDIEQMGGSTLESMALAVQDAFIFIMCVSPKYKDSQNCRAEAEYAFSLKKTVIPLIMQPHYKADGWLGFIMGSKLFYNFSKTEFFDKSATDLLKALKKKEAVEERIIVPEAAVTIETSKPSSDVSNWTEAAVVKWMSANNISREMFSDLTGKHISFLINVQRKAPEFYFRTVERLINHQMSPQELDQIISLSSALNTF